MKNKSHNLLWKTRYGVTAEEENKIAYDIDYTTIEPLRDLACNMKIISKRTD